MRLKDQSMADLITPECPYRSADDTHDCRNEQLSTSAGRECYTA
jgi:hypothetical protein